CAPHLAPPRHSARFQSRGAAPAPGGRGGGHRVGGWSAGGPQALERARQPDLPRLAARPGALGRGRPGATLVVRLSGHGRRRTGVKDRDLTRRSFVGRSLAAAALPLVPAHAGSDAARLTVVCVGGRAADPESWWCRTRAGYAALGDKGES